MRNVTLAIPLISLAIIAGCGGSQTGSAAPSTQRTTTTLGKDSATIEIVATDESISHHTSDRASTNKRFAAANHTIVIQDSRGNVLGKGVLESVDDFDVKANVVLKPVNSSEYCPKSGDTNSLGCGFDDYRELILSINDLASITIPVADGGLSKTLNGLRIDYDVDSGTYTPELH